MEGERDRAAKREPVERAPSPVAQRPALGVEPPALGNRAMLALLASRRQQASQLGGGRPLPAPLRSEMEGRFGESFEAVQVYADPDAGNAATQHNARAFTVGNDIVFGPGRYAPGTTQGNKLIAHELAHVVQQRRGSGTGGAADRSLTEGEAHRAADEEGSIRIREAAPHGIQKDDLNQTPKEPQVVGWRGGSHGFVKVNGTLIVGGGVGDEEGAFHVADNFDAATQTLSIGIYGPLGNGLEFVDDATTTLDNAALNYMVVIYEKRTIFIGESTKLQDVPKDSRQRTQPPPKPPPKTVPTKPQPTIPPSQKKPGPQPGQPQPAPQVEPPSPYQHINYPVGPQQPAFDQMKQALDAGDLATAAKLANQATDAELRSLTPLQRSLLLWALGLHPENDTLDIDQVERIINNTPDGQVQELERALSAGNGQLLNALKAHAKGDAPQRLGQAMTGLMARSILLGEPDWSIASMLGQPEFEIPKGQPMTWLGDKPDWAQNLQVWKDDVGGWNFFDEQHGFTKLDPFGKRVSKDWFAGKELFDKMRTDEQRTEELHWTGGKRYIPGKGLLDESQWQDHIAERMHVLGGETTAQIEDLESGTKLWMETQDGAAYLASGPAHLFGGRSFGDPKRIVMEARQRQASALREMGKAVTATDLEAAESKLLRVPKSGGNLFYEYKQDVFGGGETTIVVIKGTAVVATVVVAAPAVGAYGGTALGLKGLGVAVGGGMAFSSGRQGIQLLAGEREGFSLTEVGEGGVAGGVMYVAPWLAPAAMGSGMYSSLDNFEHGRPVTGTLDLLSTAGGPAAAKGLPKAIQYAKPRAARVLMLTMMGTKDATGGLPPSLSNRPNIVMVDQAGRPMNLELVNPSAGSPTPGSGVAPNPSAFVGPSASKGTGLSEIPYFIVVSPHAPSPALAGVNDVAKGYEANPVGISVAPDPGGSITGIPGTAEIGTVDRYWRQGTSDYLDPAQLGPLFGTGKIRATEAEHPHATKGVQQLLPSWSKAASPSIVFAEPQSRIKTPIDNKLTQALKDGTITPEYWLQQSRANIYRSWFAARAQGIPVPTASELATAILQQEAAMRARGVPISW